MELLLVIHAIITLLLIGIILIQRNSGEGLAIGGGGMNNFMSGRGTANLLTRTTAVLATLFIVSSLGLAIFLSRSNQQTMADRLAAAAASKPAVAAPVEAPKPGEAPKPDAATPANATEAPVVNKEAAPAADTAPAAAETPTPAATPEAPKPE